VEAALAAGIFHREEMPIEAVKKHIRKKGIETC
jgi:glutamine amidotransferase/cyclase